MYVYVSSKKNKMMIIAQMVMTFKGDHGEFRNPAKKSEDALLYRTQNRLICREFPVKETHKVVCPEDENGNKMANEYVGEYKIGYGSYGKVVLYRSQIDGKHYAIKTFRMFYFFFESRKAKADPVVIWLTGGPGCSSFILVMYAGHPSNNFDGSYPFGIWTKGLKDGYGTFYPSGSKGSSFRKFDKKKAQSQRRIPLNDDYTLGDSSREFSTSEYTNIFSHISNEYGSELDDDSTVAWEREFMQGVLMKERISLIRYTVGKITPFPMHEVRSSDFGEHARIRMYFPRKGSQFTHPRYSVDFHWKDYCPMVFRNLREMFKLDVAEYMMSICGDDGLSELSSPRKSGSIFYLSHDDRFAIKTLRRSELKV
ncbi:hypothetical protein L2E82_50339 [Cichorium intybus]|nr:hypothetical protein L2E82_50339 [Cichorium intybus]